MFFSLRAGRWVQTQLCVPVLPRGVQSFFIPYVFPFVLSRIKHDCVRQCARIYGLHTLCENVDLLYTHRVPEEGSSFEGIAARCEPLQKT